MTKKLLATALLAAGLTVGCGDEDVISPNARLDAALDGAGDAPVTPITDGPVVPPADTNPDSPIGDTASQPDSGVDGSAPDAGTPDADNQADAADSTDAGADGPDPV